MAWRGLFERYRKLLEKEVCCSKNPLPLKKLPSVPPRTNLLDKREHRINSRFTGALRAGGRIIIGPEGFVTSTLTLDELEVYGRVRGNITARRVHLHASAYVEGNIIARALQIDDGAKVTGTIHLPMAAALVSTG